jgi:hypothetical protein
MGGGGGGGGGGAWPFSVGGVICLVNSDNERDLNLLNNVTNVELVLYSLEGLATFIEAIAGL